MTSFSPHPSNINMKNIFFLCALLLTVACRQQPTENRNDPAAIPASFGFETMHLKTITTFINQKDGETSTLYGNQAAYEALKTATAAVDGEKKLVVVTWKPAEDPAWFGAMTPGEFLSIETLQSSGRLRADSAVNYEKFNGQQLTKDNTVHEQEKLRRIQLILSLQPAITP